MLVRYEQVKSGTYDRQVAGVRRCRSRKINDLPYFIHGLAENLGLLLRPRLHALHGRLIGGGQRFDILALGVHGGLHVEAGDLDIAQRLAEIELAEIELAEIDIVIKWATLAIGPSRDSNGQENPRRPAKCKK